MLVMTRSARERVPRRCALGAECCTLCPRLGKAHVCEPLTAEPRLRHRRLVVHAHGGAAGDSLLRHDVGGVAALEQLGVWNTLALINTLGFAGARRGGGVDLGLGEDDGRGLEALGVCDGKDMVLRHLQLGGTLGELASGAHALGEGER